MIGAVGPANPDEMTLRELMWQHRGKTKSLWDHTSHLMWMLYQVNASEKSPEKQPKDFHPFYCTQREEPLTRTGDLSVLKSICRKRK